jgi:hypothetical protein
MQLLGQLPMMPPHVQPQAMKELEAANTMMQMVLRHFGYDEVDRLAPRPELPQGQGAPGPVASTPAGQPGAPQGAMLPPQPGGRMMLPGMQAQAAGSDLTEMMAGPPAGTGRPQ